VQERRHPRHRHAADDEAVEQALVVGRDGDGELAPDAGGERVGEQARAGVEIVAGVAAADAEGQRSPQPAILARTGE